MPEETSNSGQEESGQEESGSGEKINIGQFIRGLASDESAKLEPMSGILLINVPRDEYLEAVGRFVENKSSADDVTLIRTINHETYHGMQAGASGYGFERQRQMFNVLNSEQMPSLVDDPEYNALVAALHAEAGDDPALAQLADETEQMLFSHRAIEFLNQRAAPGDYSIWGALYPDFFRFQEEMVKREAVPNAEGLSIEGLLEGSAVAFAHQLTTANVARANMEIELATLPPVYRQLYDLTVAKVGDRVLEVLLPTAAVAMCYSQPHEAYCALLPMLAAKPAEEVHAFGRELMGKPPELEGAGPILRTAVELRQSDDSYVLYDRFVTFLATPDSGLDAYAALAEPEVLNMLEKFPPPFALVTADGSIPTAQAVMDADEFVARLMIMSLVLRVASRRRDEVEIMQKQSQWSRELYDRVMRKMSEAPARADGPAAGQTPTP